MAKPIELPPPHRDPRETLIKKLQDAPASHAEALLDAYTILQLARDKGLLEIAKGALGSGDKVLWSLTQTAESSEVLAFLRNLTSLVKIIGGLDPLILDDLIRSLQKSVNEAKAEKAPGLWSLTNRLLSRDTRRFLGALAAVAQSVGKNMHRAQIQGKTRHKTFRHSS